MKRISGKFKSFKAIYVKVNGQEILRQYRRAGILPYMLLQAVLLGFSKTSLEILRLIGQRKICKKLAAQYAYVLNGLSTDEDCAHQSSNRVWVCWLQGIENAPVIVQRCVCSMRESLPDREIILLTSDNFGNYVTLPASILEKWHNGVITNTHFTDILRLELLIRYGGAWIDATVFCTGNTLPCYIWDSNLFMYQAIKPGKDGRYVNISSWFIIARSQNKILIAARECLYEYWKKNTAMVDYGLVHDFIRIAGDRYPDAWNAIPKLSNGVPHMLLNELFEPFDEPRYDHIKLLTCFHKLSYKQPSEMFEKKGTYYDVLFRGGDNGSISKSICQ